jgi:hypothetical protein
MDAFDREEQLIEDAFDSGAIDANQRNYEMRELQRDYQAMVEEECQRAADDKRHELTGGW